MINVIVEPALLLGAIFAVVMIVLYSLRFINADLATDWDIFITIAIFGLLSSDTSRNPGNIG